MKINKSWVAAILVYLASQVVKSMNITVSDGWEDTAYTIAINVVQYGSVIMAALWNKYVNHQTVTVSEVQQEIAAAKSDTTTPKTYQEMVPVMSEVHEAVNDLLAQVKSGKYTSATEEAMQTYLKLYELLKNKGA